MPDLDSSIHFLSIGALSKATGIPTDTLRTWERRYGFPTPERTESGHRRYRPQTLERLRLIQRAMRLGQPASAAVGADPEALQALVVSAEETRPSAAPSVRPAAPEIEGWFDLIKQFDGVQLDREMRVSVTELGSHLFLAQRAGPFVEALGERWSSGELGVRHEHFASERLREVLVDTWRPLSDAATRGPVVCATPPGEMHVLGLHMAALALALEGVRIVFLGADTPIDEVVESVVARRAAAVALSASIAVNRDRLRRDVRSLRAKLPAGVQLVGGGAGFDDEIPGITAVSRFADLTRWAHSLGRD